LFPFLNKAANEKCVGWEIAIETCFGHKHLCATAIQIVLTVEKPPENLLQQALRLLSEFPRVVDSLYPRNKLPKNLLPIMLEHPDPSVAQAAALAEWQCDPTGKVRDWLRPAWEQSILKHDVDDYWLAEIFKTEKHLAFAWIEPRITNDEFKTYNFKRTISAAISSLNQSERFRLLEIVPACYGYHDIVAQIVADDLMLFSKLLGTKRLEEFHLSPLSGDVDTAWREKAKLAYEARYSPEKIAARTIMPEGVVVSWSGKESERYKRWLDRFNKLQESDDEIVKIIGQAGSDMCDELYKKALDREHIEDVYGRD
jgi:hypothetical protein